MKGKTKTYILLAFVLAIWGVIGYKIVATLNPEPPKLAKNEIDVSFNPKTTKDLDTFSIQTANRDPFLGTLLVKKKTRIKKIASKMVWLPITYHGNIKQSHSKNRVFIISINNKQSLMKLRQVTQGVKLIRGNANEIVVAYKNHRKTIKKE